MELLRTGKTTIQVTPESLESAIQEFEKAQQDPKIGEIELVVSGSLPTMESLMLISLINKGARLVAGTVHDRTNLSGLGVLSHCQKRAIGENGVFALGVASQDDVDLAQQVMRKVALQTGMGYANLLQMYSEGATICAKEAVNLNLVDEMPKSIPA